MRRRKDKPGLDLTRLFGKAAKPIEKILCSPFTMVALLSLWSAFYTDQTSSRSNPLLTLAIILIWFIVFAVWPIVIMLINRREKVRQGGEADNEYLVFAVIAVGFLLRILYTVYSTPYNSNQNDGGSFTGDLYGHYGYIHYLFENAKLPDFNPIQHWQFYHPPLHYIIAAAWAKLNLLVGIPFGRMIENIQILTLLYSGLTLIVSDRILKLLKQSIFVRVLALSLIGVYPYLIMTAGTVNNDCLLILLSMICVYLTIRWYQNPSLKLTLLLAAVMGLAINTKLSGTLMAPAIALVFLIKFIKLKPGKLKMALKFGAFGGVVFPLGLWFYIRNYLLFQVPLTYVPLLSNDTSQYIGHYTVWQRLFNFSFSQLGTYRLSFNAGDADITYNIFYALLKYGSFNEYPVGMEGSFGTMVGYSLLAMMFLITLAVVGLFLVALINKRIVGEPWLKLLFAVMVLTYTASYVKFCFDYPHVCTMNIRYILFAIILSILAASMALGYLRDTKKRVYQNLSIAVCTSVYLFSAFSITSLLLTLIGYVKMG